MSTRKKRADIDKYDVAILSALADNTRLSTVELATIVHLSRTAVSRRIAALKRASVLRDAGDVLNYESLGFSVRALVEITAPSRSIENLQQQLVRRPEVLAVAVIAGDGLLCVNVIAIDMDHLQRFIQSLQEVGETSTKIVFAEKKSQLTLIERMQMLKESNGLAS